MISAIIAPLAAFLCAASMPTDSSLTMEQATHTVQALHAVDSVLHAHPDIKLAHVNQGPDSAAAFARELTAIPSLVTVITRAGLTPETYALLYIRIHVAWRSLVNERIVRDQYHFQGEIKGRSPQLRADLAFIEAHEAELQRLGFTAPEPGIMMN